MTSISSGIPVNQPAAKLMDMSNVKKIHVSELPEEAYQNFVEMQERLLEIKYTTFPDISKSATYEDYAKITVNGNTVATIDNNGHVISSGSMGGKIQSALAELDNHAEIGPRIAQNRAEYLADILSGTVEVSSTAMTQSEFVALHQPNPTINYEAMRQDPAYEQLQKTREARTLFAAQQMAQESSAQEKTDNQIEEPVIAKQTTEDKFREFMEKTPEEILFEAILEELGLTREEFEALPPQEKEKITTQIEQKIKERVAASIDENTTETSATKDKADLEKTSEELNVMKAGHEKAAPNEGLNASGEVKQYLEDAMALSAIRGTGITSFS